MDIIFSALASEIASRTISFIVAKYQKQTTMDKTIRLHQLLLRARTIIEEADGRHISNQAMLLQLRQLRNAMYEGHYVLDTFKGQTEVNKPFNNLSKIQVSIESLESTIGDLKEFVVFLMDCPRFLREPYNTYLFMERCMFGRHVEKDRIIDFLMQPSSSSLEILPVIGPREIGKRTLVEHVLNKEMVQKHFSHIIRLSSDDLNNIENDSTSKGHNLISFTERSLLVVELEHEADLVAWGRFRSSLSKINIMIKVLLISCVQKVSTSGTTGALKLKRMRSDEFWNFFRTLCFGSENPYEHQLLLSMALKMAKLAKGDFVCANIVSRLLRANFSTEFWSHMLDRMIKGQRLHFHLFGEHANDRVGKNRSHIAFDIADGTVILANKIYTSTTSLEDTGVLKITVENLLNKTAIIPTEGNFEVLRWQSPIAPYYSYLGNCVNKKASQVVPKERYLKRKRKV